MRILFIANSTIRQRTAVFTRIVFKKYQNIKAFETPANRYT